jgi:hypothetical protein
MSTVEIDQDMDHAACPRRKDLAQCPEHDCPDFSRVRFLDAAEIDGVVLFRQALRKPALESGPDRRTEL